MLNVDSVLILQITGWSSGAAALPVFRQCHPLLPQRDPRSSRHHSCAQRFLHMPQHLRGGVRVPPAHCGGQLSSRHQSLLLHSHRLHR